MTYLASLGLSTTTVDHPPVFTVAESDAVACDIKGGHTKNLFLRDAKGLLFLVVAEATTPVNLKSLHRQLGCARFSFGKPELLLDALGVAPGSVTAFAVINDPEGRVRVVLDQALFAHDVINCHPLTNTATTSIARDDLLTFLNATGHEPVTLPLGTIEIA